MRGKVVFKSSLKLHNITESTPIRGRSHSIQSPQQINFCLFFQYPSKCGLYLINSVPPVILLLLANIFIRAFLCCHENFIMIFTECIIFHRVNRI